MKLIRCILFGHIPEGFVTIIDRQTERLINFYTCARCGLLVEGPVESP